MQIIFRKRSLQVILMTNNTKTISFSKYYSPANNTCSVSAREESKKNSKLTIAITKFLMAAPEIRAVFTKYLQFLEKFIHESFICGTCTIWYQMHDHKNTNRASTFTYYFSSANFKQPSEYFTLVYPWANCSGTPISRYFSKTLVLK